MVIQGNTITLPLLNSGVFGLRMGPYVPNPRSLTTISGNPGRVIYQILDTSKNPFFFKICFHGGREIRTHDQQLKSFDDASGYGTSPLGY